MIELLIFIVSLVVAFFVFKKIKDFQTKKGTSKVLSFISATSISVLAFFMVIIVGGSIFTDFKPKEPIENERFLKVISVSDFSYTRNDKQIVSITVGYSKDEYFEISLFRKDVKNGFSAFEDKNNYTKTIDSSGTIGKDFYKLLFKDDFKSFAYFKIKKLDKTNKIAVVEFELSLINPKTLKYWNIQKQTLEISGVMFDNLIMKI
jgi:hypothetical protein